MHRDFVEALEADRLEDLSVDRRILLKWLKELRCAAMDIEFILEHSNGPFISLWLDNPLLDLGRFFTFLIFNTDDRIPWTRDQFVARPLHVHRTAQT
jgi:hypothetical protein